MTAITYDDIRDVLDRTASDLPDSDLDPWKGIAEGLVTDDLDTYADLPDDQDALDDVAALVAAAYYTGEGTVAQESQGPRQTSYRDGDMSYWRIAKQRDPTGRLDTVDIAENAGRYTGSV